MYWIYTTVCLCSLATALATTPLIKSTAIRYEKLDAPANRKIHYQPMVRLGGIAIFVATFVASVAGVFWMSPYASIDSTFNAVLPLLVGGFAFFSIGLADDLLDLSAFSRLWLQIIIAALLWLSGLQIDSLHLPGFELISLSLLSLPITVLWIVGVINAINWIDGLDGLASGISAIAVTTLAVIGMLQNQPACTLLGIALLGSLLGFLFYNYNPAKIFMGDGGSYFIGFILAGISISGPFQLDTPTASLLPIAILAVPLGDMTSVIMLRIYQQKSPFEADNLHLHHRLLKQQFSHRETVWIMYALTALSCSLTFVLVNAISMMLIVFELLALGFFLSYRTIKKNQKRTDSRDSLEVSVISNSAAPH